MLPRPWFVRDGTAHWMPNGKGVLVILIFAMVVSATAILMVAAGASLAPFIGVSNRVAVGVSIGVFIVAAVIEFAGFLKVVVWSSRQLDG